MEDGDTNADILTSSSADSEEEAIVSRTWALEFKLPSDFFEERSGHAIAVLRERVECETCQHFLAPAVFSMEPSNVGGHKTAVVKFPDAHSETLYEKHLATIHRLTK